MASTRKYVWFTYIHDEEVFKISHAMVKMIDSDAKCCVVDDGLNRCSDKFIKYCKDNNIEYHVSTFARGGNMVGTEACNGVIKWLWKCSEDCDIVIKVDCDTLIIKLDWIQRLENDDNAVFTGAYMNWHAYPAGGSYAIKSKVLKAMYDDIERYPAWRTSIENYEVGQRAFRVGGSDLSVIRYTCDERNGFIMGTPYGFNVDPLIQLARWWTAGYTYTGQPNTNKDKYKADQLSAMKTVYNRCKELYGKALENKPKEEPKDKQGAK